MRYILQVAKLKSKVIGLHLHDHDVGTLNLNFETILDSRHFLHLFRGERSINFGGIIAFSPLLIRLLAAENYLSSANVKYFVRKR